VGEQDGTCFLVMEFVDGETLEHVLRRGRLSRSDALTYAIQIAEALESAHGSGIIHRDLKPGNIIVTRAGMVKLLDFGLARLTAEDARPQESATAATRSGPLTAIGTILGTVQYMAPEQLEGEEVDARSDIFSFGTIAYEMLGGRKAFEGKSAAALTAAILTSDPPPLATLGPTPAPLDQLVRQCLAKNRDDRWQSAHDVRKQLEWIRASLTQPQPSRGKTWMWTGVAVLLVAAVALAGVYAYSRRPAAASGPFMRLTMSFQGDVRYSVGEDFVRSASISPDGERIVFTGADQKTGTTRLYIRPVGSDEATPVEGSEYGTEPFWSPTSDAVGFYANGKVMVGRLAGGAPQAIADATSTGGASWNRKGQILISLQNPGPLMLVPATGGTPSAATVLDTSTETDHDWPQFLDDEVHFLYMARGRTAATNKVYVGSLQSHARTLLLEGVGAFAYASPGHVLFVKDNDLMAQAIDPDRLVLTGVPIALAHNAQPPFSASRTGALTYRTVPPDPNPLLWLRRDGTLIDTAIPAGYYTDPQVSPDGTKIALAARDSPDARWHVAVIDVATSTSRKLTLDAATARAPVWSPDGQSIVFLSLRSAAPGLYRKNANGVGEEELILRSPGVAWPYQWSGNHLFYFAGVSGGNDIGMLTFPAGTSSTLINSPFNDVDGAISPDGKWFAYSSNESGRWEIYLTTFPVSSTKLAVTTQGGCDPTWSPDGKDLYYTRPASTELMAMSVTPGAPPTFGVPRRIHVGPFEYPSAHSIDFDRKNDRLLVAPSFAVRGDLTVLVNWQSRLTH
jgi:Tol biopolymer transport system component